ncbi:MAG: hypothetical protein KY429_09105 [Actinobacteria bacterium]|nr:hypothetical protein [Actinomycetota bacterium]
MSDRAPSMGSARLQMIMSMRFSFPSASMGNAQPPEPTELSFTIDGLTDFRRKLGSMEMKTGAGSQSGITLPEIRTIYDADFVYYEVPPKASAAFDGKSWVRVSLEEMVQGGFDLSSPTPQPEIFFERLKGVGAHDITTVGEESIRGTHTTHYRVALTWQDYMAALPPETRDQQISRMEAVGLELEPVDAWIDDDGFARKLLVTMGNEDKMNITMTLELYDFGVEVQVQIPSEQEVFVAEDPSVLGALFGGGGALGSPSVGVGSSPQSDSR